MSFTFFISKLLTEVFNLFNIESVKYLGASSIFKSLGNSSSTFFNVLLRTALLNDWVDLSNASPVPKPGIAVAASSTFLRPLPTIPPSA